MAMAVRTHAPHRLHLHLLHWHRVHVRRTGPLRLPGLEPGCPHRQLAQSSMPVLRRVRLFPRRVGRQYFGQQSIGCQ